MFWDNPSPFFIFPIILTIISIPPQLFILLLILLKVIWAQLMKVKFLQLNLVMKLNLHIFIQEQVIYQVWGTNHSLTQTWFNQISSFHPSFKECHKFLMELLIEDKYQDLPWFLLKCFKAWFIWCRHWNQDKFCSCT